ncbi:MAG TPA: hypothetical protein VM869_04940 [Enhygromyxa sp.]|nr:hypothetical protein [Enhygromyxa sp.]
MRTLLFGFTFAVALLVLPGCDRGEACTSDLRPSVVVDVVDAETAEPVATAVVTFTIDGGAEQLPNPLNVPDEGEFVLEYEKDGLFAVTIEADGYEPAYVEYDVAEDGCHVVSVYDTVELVPVAP